MTSWRSSPSVGGLTGALVGYGIPDEEAAYYEMELAAGRTVVLISGDDLDDAFATVASHQARHHRRDLRGPRVFGNSVAQ
jgi:hypothetical protein